MADSAVGLAESARRQSDACVISPDATDRECAYLIQCVRTASPGSTVLLVSADADQRAVLSALEAGAAGYLHKSRGMLALLAGIERVLRGEMCWEAQVTLSYYWSRTVGDPVQRFSGHRGLDRRLGRQPTPAIAGARKVAGTGADGLPVGAAATPGDPSRYAAPAGVACGGRSAGVACGGRSNAASAASRLWGGRPASAGMLVWGMREA